MKKIFTILIVFSLITLLVGCSTNKVTSQKAEQKAPKVEEKITPGNIEGSTYSNPFFGLQVTIPQGWTVKDNETIKTLAEKGDKTMDASKLKTVEMLDISAKNASGYIEIDISAEKVNDDPKIKTGSDYLLLLKKNLIEKEHYDAVFTNGTEQVGGVKFEKMDATIKGKATVYQKYYVTIKKGYAIGITTTYLLDQDLKEINNVLSSVKVAN